MPGTKERTRHRPRAANGNGTQVNASYDYPRGAMNGTAQHAVVYEVDHLATFTVGASNGVLYAEDGMRKLREMENGTGIWTMRCKLLIEGRQVSVIDKQTSEELERYHWGQVSDPTAIISHDHSEVFNNILLFTVHEDRSHPDAVSEMHIFQSISQSARELVEDIKAAQMGQLPGIKSDLDPSAHRANYSYDANLRPADPPVRDSDQPSRGSRLLQHVLGRQDLSAPTEQVDFKIKLLNHCFDDIERFIVRLQVSAEAYRELGKRGSSKNNGMLKMRARVPPPGDFMDTLAKLKLAFILLGQLRNVIRDPNAPEIVHFLFTPLALMVSASKDPKTQEPDLASKVISPLLTQDAKELLEYCLTTKENDLWLSLGDAWTVSSEEWQGDVRPYYPQFSDGWQPSVELLDTLVSGPLRFTQDVPLHTTVERFDSSRNLSQDQPSPSSGYSAEAGLGGLGTRTTLEHSPQANPLYSQINKSQRQEQWSSDDDQLNFTQRIRRNGTQCYEVRFDRAGGNDKELSVRRGEALEVLDDRKNWWLVRNAQGREGFVPYTILKPWELHSDGEHSNTRSHSELTEMRSSYNGEMSSQTYDGQRAETAVFGNRPGVFIRSLRQGVIDEQPVERDPVPPPPPPADAAMRRRYSQRPLGPPPKGELAEAEAEAVAAVVNATNAPKDHRPSIYERRELTQNGQEFPNGSAPLQRQHFSLPAGLEDVQEVQTKYDAREEARNNKRRSLQAQHKIHQELHERVALQKVSSTGKLPVSIPERAANSLYINEKSGAREVNRWLQFKGFSVQTQTRLQSYNGLQMFQLTRSRLDELLAAEEAARLESQLRVQKSLGGYQSQRGEQLKTILAQRLQQTETTGEDREDSLPSPDYSVATPPRRDSGSQDQPEDLKDLESKTLRAQLIRQRQKLARTENKFQ